MKRQVRGWPADGSLVNHENHWIRELTTVHFSLQLICWGSSPHSPDRCLILLLTSPSIVRTMEWLFGRKKTPDELLRQNQRVLNKAIRELERERTKMEGQVSATRMRWHQTVTHVLLCCHSMNRSEN